MNTIAADILGINPAALVLIGTVVLIVLMLGVFMLSRYKRCPANRVLVIYGIVPGGKAHVTMRSGGTLVLPIIQDFAYLPLEPIRLDVKVEIAGSGIDAELIVAIDPEEPALDRAVEHLLGLKMDDIADCARSVAEARFRDALDAGVAERQAMLDHVDKPMRLNFSEIGLKLISVNLRSLRVSALPVTA